jgi:hypothetical protein
MNRHERRRTAAQARHNKFVADCVSHLPEVSPAAAPEPRRVFRAVFYHDEWCRIYVSGTFWCLTAPTEELHER